MLLGILGIVDLEQVLDDVGGGVEDVVLPLAAFENGTAQRVDGFTLLVHDVVVFEQVLTRFEVASLDLLLRALDGARDHAVFDRDALLHAEAFHPAHQAIAAEDAHQVVFEREVEAR